MKIQQKDLYHGAALTQIVEHPSFKALNRASSKYGHYLVNADREVYAKYLTTSQSPWRFTLQPADTEALSKSIATAHKVFLCLVCGDQTICVLNTAEVREVIALDADATKPQWICVEVPKDGSCHVDGSFGTLQRTVPHNAFPNKVFQ